MRNEPNDYDNDAVMRWFSARIAEAAKAPPGHDYLMEPAPLRKRTPLGRQGQDLDFHARSLLEALDALRAQLLPAIEHEEATAAQRADGESGHPLLLEMLDTATWRLADAEESIHFMMRFLLTQRTTAC